ncbi:hypothetical protein HK096_001532, partial [Nowakowskiella sp. JEL0078]
MTVAKLHPLEPLTENEITRTVNVLKTSHSSAEHPKSLTTRISQDTTIFNAISLLEPTKKKLVEYEVAKLAGRELPFVAREALVTLILADGCVVEAVVDVETNKISSLKELEHGLQPPLTPDDCLQVEKIAIEDDGVLKECAKCGFTNPSLIICDPWSVGYIPEYEGYRIVQVFMYVKMHEDDNQYAHPLDFLPLVDLISKKVVKIEYLPERKLAPVKVPLKEHNYMEKFQPKLSTTLKPLDIIQPEGPSFKIVNGSEISWHKFKLRFSFNHREGLVLHNVRWVDEGVERSILHRAALNEMVVPYGDPRAPYNRKTAFDIGDYGLGYMANSLELGCDCVGEIKYVDAVLSNNKGEPYVIKNAICIHEEDTGIVWKHTEYRNGKAEVRRNRKLVLSFIATVVNYEYAFYYSFFVDGTISVTTKYRQFSLNIFDIKATGELSTNVIADDEIPAYGVLVADGVNAQYHQHMFNIRLDFAVDGHNNSISELTSLPMEDGPENPYGNGFFVQETPITSEMMSGRMADPAHARIWKIYNPSKINPVTRKPTAWKLMPMATPVLLAKDNSSIANRAVFATKHLWVTKFNEDEKWAAGTYINQNKGGEGLPKFIESDENLENTELTVWHTFGVTHIPRAEDFP